MLNRWQFNVVVLLAVVSLVLVIANMSLFSRNRLQQQEISDRQLYVQQTAQLEGLYQQLIRGIAELSARNNDAALGAVLARQGITFTVTPTAQQNPSAADPGASARTARK
jgi:hypothetical protein